MVEDPSLITLHLEDRLTSLLKQLQGLSISAESIKDAISRLLIELTCLRIIFYELILTLEEILSSMLLYFKRIQSQDMCSYKFILLVYS